MHVDNNEGYVESPMPKDLYFYFDIKNDEIFKLYFDGSYSKEGSIAMVLLIYPTEEKIPLSYKI